MSDVPVLGRFAWHELLTTDTKAAGRFFSKVIGWNTKPWPQDPSYVNFMSGKRPAAGVMALPEDAKAMGTPPNWCTHVASPNVDDTVRLAVSLGATVLRQPWDIPNVGRLSIIRDPQGAIFAISTFNDVPFDDGSKPGGFSWHELGTTDWKAALAFYQRLFGWETTDAMDMGPELGTYQMYGVKGKPLGGMFNKPANVPGPAYWLPYIKVADAKKTAAAATKAGGKIVNGPMEIPGGGWIAVGLDPQGAMFAVHSSARAAVAAKPEAKKAAKKKPVKKAAKKAAKKVAPKKASAKKAVKKVAKKAARKTAKKAAKKSAKKSARKRSVKKASRRR